MRSVLACILVTCFLLGCGTTKNQAHQATAVDAATTAIGVSSGIATEVNPLISSSPIFLGLMATRVVGVELINKLDEPQRTAHRYTNIIQFNLVGSKHQQHPSIACGTNAGWVSCWSYGWCWSME